MLERGGLIIRTLSSDGFAMVGDCNAGKDYETAIITCYLRVAYSMAAAVAKMVVSGT